MALNIHSSNINLSAIYTIKFCNLNNNYKLTYTTFQVAKYIVLSLYLNIIVSPICLLFSTPKYL